MNFNQWLLLNENVETNFNKWLEVLFQYTKKNTDAEKVLMKIPGVPARSDLIGVDPKNWEAGGREQLGYIIDIRSAVIIKTVLKEKNIENFNWFSFSVGYYSAKPGFFKEDLELAIDVTKQRIDSRELPKTEIGAKGWLVVGYEALDHVSEYLRQQQTLSNRQKLKLNKSGQTLEEDENLIKILDQKENLKLYFLPLLSNSHNDWNSSEYANQREARKRLLCKYGKDTDWCTANPTGSYHEYYVDQDIYILHENDKPKYQFTGCHRGLTPQFMDTKDRSVSEISQKYMEFLQHYLGDCYSNISVRVNGGEEYLKSEFKERISWKNIIEICDDKHTSAEALEAIYSLDWFWARNLKSNSDDPKKLMVRSIAANPNTPEKILVDIYNKQSTLHSKLEVARLVVANQNTPKDILDDILKLLIGTGDLKHIVYNSRLALDLAKNPNSDIEILNKLFEIIKLINNKDYRVRLGVEILKNKNSKQNSELIEEVVKTIKQIIKDPETYDFTLRYLVQQMKSLPDELREEIKTNTLSRSKGDVY